MYVVNRASISYPFDQVKEGQSCYDYVGSDDTFIINLALSAFYDSVRLDPDFSPEFCDRVFDLYQLTLKSDFALFYLPFRDLD